ncbi:MAG TPA: helix-turn-helix transcriptional regulator [Xanthobacteraceae bacterium]|jgi:transcriptional regulator with XRE-family HTH domain
MMTDITLIVLTAAQSRAARALLGWSQTELARRASVATSTVADFERGQRSPVTNNLEALKLAFEKEDITFPPGGAVVGALPKMVARSRVPQDRVRPIRWIKENNFDQWGSSRVGQDTFPELIRRLVLAEAGYHPELRFPSGDSVAMQGWDGETNVEVASPIIPSGPAGWELGTTKQPKAKADQDYEQRTKDPLHFVPKETTFVFVTLRRWAKKAEWEKAKKEEGIWKDVRVIDAVDLVQWLERFPAVALWFAHHIELLPPDADVRTLDQVWDEWSLSTTPPLSVSLVLADRDDNATQIWQWLLKQPSVLALQADAPIEAKAFLHAAIEQYPTDYRDFYHSRTIVAAKADAARALADVGTPLIIVLEDAEPGLTNSLVQKGHHVFVALTVDEGAQGTALRRPIRYTIEHELTGMFQEELKQRKITRADIQNRAHDSARSLTILRRLMPSAPGIKTPQWATKQNARFIIPALLTGAWNENKAADKRVLESLSGLAYDELARELTPILQEPDSPLRKIGAAWAIASPRDAWFRLAIFLTAADLEKFSKLTADVLGSADPRFNLEPDERWRADDLVGDDAAYSGLIRTGMAEVLVLSSVFGAQAKGVTDAKLYTDKVVKRLLGTADAERWWSLHRQLRVLAEASPEEFLNAVDKSLAQNDPPIMKLFEEGGDPLFFGGGGEYPHLLWALEVLAWSPDYLARVTDILAKLTELDPKGRLTNRPRNTFQDIYRLWRPQTFATLQQRNAVLRRLRKTYPQTAWGLLLNLYPKSHDTATDSAAPRWRDFSVDKIEPATHAIIFEGAEAIGGWLLEDVGTDAKRWQELFERLGDFAPDLRKNIVQRLVVTAPRIKSDNDKVIIQQALRRLLHHHRQFEDAGWTLPADELQAIETAYHLFQPENKLLRIKWLFDEHHAPLLQPENPRDWEANSSASDKERRKALADLVNEAGVTAVRDLYHMVRLPSLVGRAFAQNNEMANFPTEFIEALKTDEAAEWDFAHGGLFAYFEKRGNAWADKVIARAVKEKWGDLALQRILLSLPKTEHFIECAAKIGGSVEAAYWTKLEIFQINVPATKRPAVVERLLQAKRAWPTVSFAGQYVTDIPSSLLVQVLTEALAYQPKRATDGNEGTMFQHYVTQIFERLDKDATVDQGQIAGLEWSYLRVLEFSNRTPKALPKVLATSPELFLKLLSAAYRGEKDEKGLDENAEDYEVQKRMAGQAWSLLHSWAHVPGLSDDGKSVDGAKLEAWVRKARILSAKAERAAIGDQMIGQVLAHAPADEDGTWPCLPVRELIEFTRSKDLEAGIKTGVYNARGVTTRSPTDGGAQERVIAARYREWSEKTGLEFPRTGAMLAQIAETYDRDAKYHDDDADIRQW